LVIAGLQKLSLLDYPDRLCCTVFTAGCNFRCPFCHNSALIPFGAAPALSEADFFAFLAERRGRLEAVCLTGGEPLLQPDLPAFIKKLREAGYLVKLDTNGYRPEKLRRILAEGLVDYVAMDVKAAPGGYAAAAGVPVDVQKIEASAALLKSGAVPYEFRTTAVKGLHTPADFAAIGRWIRGAPRYFIQQFVDSGAVLSDEAAPLDPEEMRACLDAVLPYVPAARLRGLR
jgi:pyruvate formate lyase activating enzyme